MSRSKRQFPIAPVLEALGAVGVPHLVSGHRKMLCPFHDEKHPSASVSEFGFNCFGCERSGDAIKLVMEEERVSYADAVARCEEITGISGETVSRGSGWANVSRPVTSSSASPVTPETGRPATSWSSRT
jgi:hypothetical protein